MDYYTQDQAQWEEFREEMAKWRALAPHLRAAAAAGDKDAQQTLDELIALLVEKRDEYVSAIRLVDWEIVARQGNHN